jgi:hypothetical protein
VASKPCAGKSGQIKGLQPSVSFYLLLPTDWKGLSPMTTFISCDRRLREKSNPTGETFRSVNQQRSKPAWTTTCSVCLHKTFTFASSRFCQHQTCLQRVKDSPANLIQCPLIIRGTGKIRMNKTISYWWLLSFRWRRRVHCSHA